MASTAKCHKADVVPVTGHQLILHRHFLQVSIRSNRQHWCQCTTRHAPSVAPMRPSGLWSSGATQPRHSNRTSWFHTWIEMGIAFRPTLMNAWMWSNWRLVVVRRGPGIPNVISRVCWHKSAYACAGWQSTQLRHEKRWRPGMLCSQEPLISPPTIPSAWRQDNCCEAQTGIDQGWFSLAT